VALEHAVVGAVLDDLVARRGLGRRREERQQAQDGRGEAEHLRAHGSEASFEIPAAARAIETPAAHAWGV
jgi:hypothetical protein